ncbi:MAG: hypothetical protein FJX76_02640 [Armatimonadetes bacterium]|nr:hypothetical protein [Armatimonadota bacterium]
MAIVQLLFSLFLFALGGAVVGVCLFPGIALTYDLWLVSASQDIAVRLLLVSVGLGCTYFIYGFMLLLVTGTLFRVLRLQLHPGEYELLSPTSLRWVLGSALGLVVKVTFMDFLALTPYLTWWFRMMGAKVGREVMINSKYVHDASLLEIGDGTVIGGEAAISCHAVEHGKLILKKIVVGRKCLIGQRSILMPGVVIGDGAVIGAQAMVLKDAVVPAGETWIGIPAAPMHRVQS